MGIYPPPKLGHLRLHDVPNGSIASVQRGFGHFRFTPNSSRRLCLERCNFHVTFVFGPDLLGGSLVKGAATRPSVHSLRGYRSFLEPHVKLLLSSLARPGVCLGDTVNREGFWTAAGGRVRAEVQGR